MGANDSKLSNGNLDYPISNGNGHLHLSKKELKKLKKKEQKLKKSKKESKNRSKEEDANQAKVTIREEVVEEFNNNLQKDMALPNGHGVSMGDGGGSPILHRSSPAFEANGKAHMIPELSSSSADPRAYLDKQDESHFLANLLAEERKRCNQHKENYNTLKQEHRNLQNEMLNLQEEVKELNNDKTDLVERQAQEFGSYESQLTVLRNKIAELQSQMPGKGRIDALKSQMISDVEGPFRSRLENLEEDNESLRVDNAKLKHDFAFLKSEYEHTLQRHKSTLEELKLQHEAEVSNLARDKDDLVRRLHQDNSGDVERLRTLQKENSALNHKVKSLLTELEELRSQREKVGLESDHIQRIQNKQMVEFQANVRALEIEKDTLRKQCDSQARELSVLVDSQTELTKRLHEEEQRVASLRNELEKAKHEATLQLTQYKLDSTKSKGAIERERDSLIGQVDDVKSRVEAQQMVIQQLEETLRQKERDCAERINTVREEEFQKLSQSNHDRQKLESRVQILERQKLEFDDKTHRDQLRCEQQLREIQNSKDQMEKELNIVRSKLTNQNQLQNDIDYERSRSNEQRNQIMKMEAEIAALRATENELTELVGHLRVKITATNEDLRRSKAMENTQHNTADKVLAQHKAVWADEKQDMQKRVGQVETKLRETQQALSKQAEEYSKKKIVYSKLVEKLRRKLEVTEAEKEELKIQVESVKGFVPPEIFNKCKRELKDLKNRHREYKHIMLSGDITHVPIGEKSFASASVHNANFDISPDRTQDLPDLTTIVKRIDKLDENQRKQMAEFGINTPSVASSSLDDVDVSI